MDKKEHNLFETMQFDKFDADSNQTEEIISSVLQSLRQKNYNPLNQLVGYIISGDPTYITSHNNARSLIMKIERDTLLEEIVNFYLENNKNIR